MTYGKEKKKRNWDSLKNPLQQRSSSGAEIQDYIEGKEKNWDLLKNTLLADEHDPIVSITNKLILKHARQASTHVAGYGDGKPNATMLAIQHLAKKFNIAELEDWKPSMLPKPEPAIFDYSQKRFTRKSLRTICTKKTRNLDKETAELRGNPEKFVEIRNSYVEKKQRRDPSYYTIKISKTRNTDDWNIWKETLEQLQFNVEIVD